MSLGNAWSQRNTRSSSASRPKAKAQPQWSGVLEPHLRRSVYYDTPQQKVRALEARVEDLEARLKAAQEAHLHQADDQEEQECARHLEELEDQATELREGRAEWQSKIDRHEHLRRSLIGLVQEVRKQAGVALTEDAASLENRELTLLAEGVRDFLRHIFEAKQRHEADIERDIEDNDLKFKERSAELKADISQAQVVLDTEQGECDRLNAILERSEKEIKEACEDADVSLHDTKEEHDKLASQLKVAASENAVLNLWNYESLHHIQQQDAKIASIPHIVSRTKRLAKRTHAEQENICQGQIEKVRRYEKQLCRKTQVEARHDHLQEEIRRLRHEASGLRRDHKHKQVEALETRRRLHGMELERKEEHVSRLEAQCQSMRDKIQEKEDNLQQCTKEHGRVSAELKRLRDQYELAAEAEEPEEETLQQHPYVTEVLKKKVRDANDEIQKVGSRLRLMLVNEKKAGVQEKTFADERKRYEAELEGWRQKLERSEDRYSRLTQTQGLAILPPEDESDVDYLDLSAIDLRSRSPSPKSTRSAKLAIELPRSPSPRRALAPAALRGQHQPRLKPARPRSAVTGRQLPAAQMGTCSATSIEVGALLPQNCRPRSAPRFRSCA